MTKFTITACVAVLALGAVIGRSTAPSPAQASEQARTVATYELTLKAGALPVQSADAI